jgi:lipoate-protein ligase A
MPPKTKNPDDKVIEDFEKAVKDLEENDSRHVVPDFLKERLDPDVEIKKIRPDDLVRKEAQEKGKEG